MKAISLLALHAAAAWLLAVPVYAQTFQFAENAAGASFRGNDMKLFRAAVRKALDSQSDNKPLTWKNPDTGASGVVVVTETFKMDETTCRRTQSTNQAGGAETQQVHNFCKQEDGTWKIDSRRRKE